MNQVLTDRELGTTPGWRRRDVPIDDLGEPELLGPVPEHSRGAKLPALDPLETGRFQALPLGAGSRTPSSNRSFEP